MEDLIFRVKGDPEALQLPQKLLHDPPPGVRPNPRSPNGTRRLEREGGGGGGGGGGEPKETVRSTVGCSWSRVWS